MYEAVRGACGVCVCVRACVRQCACPWCGVRWCGLPKLKALDEEVKRVMA